MKTKLGLLLLMLLFAVGCDDSIQSEQVAGSVNEQPNDPVPSDLSVIELPSITNTLGMTFNNIPTATFLMGSPETEKDRYDGETQHEVRG